MSVQPLKISLPDGRHVDVEEVVGPEAFQTFLEKFQHEVHTLTHQQKTEKRLFVLFTPKPVVSEDPQNVTAYALYQNGGHIAVYKLEQTQNGFKIGHCAPTNERTITPEIRALLQSLPSPEIVDVGRKKGLYFNQDQEFVKRDAGETELAFKTRLVMEGLRQIDLMQQQSKNELRGLKR